jgi:O-antigen/teichoic acid export membrane protein
VSKQLKIDTLSGVRWTTTSSLFVAAMYLAQVSLLARLLSKEDFGVVSIAMVVLGFAQAFVDMGFSNAIIHKQTARKDQLDTLYWFNVLSGVTIFSVIVISSGLVSQFYEEPKLQNVLIFTGLNFIIQPFGIQFKVLLQKDIKFNLISKIEIVGSFFGFIVALIWAIKSPSVYALVFSFIANSLVSTLLFVFFSPREHFPRMRFKVSEISEFLSFGFFQMGERILNYFNSQFDVLLIGKVLGAEVVGVYAMSKQLVLRPAQIVNPIVTKVTFPVMSKLQEDDLKLQAVYNKTINYLSSINFPLYGAIWILAPQIVRVVFGNSWDEAIPIIRILSIFAALRSTGNPIGSLLLAKGRAKLAFYWNLGLFFIIPATMYAGSFFGLLGVCYSLVLLMVILVIPNWYFQVHSTAGGGFWDYHKQIFIPGSIATISSFLAYYLSVYVVNDYLKIVTVSLIGGASCLILNYYFNRKFLTTLGELINRPKKSTS